MKKVSVLLSFLFICSIQIAAHGFEIVPGAPICSIDPTTPVDSLSAQHNSVGSWLLLCKTTGYRPYSFEALPNNTVTWKIRITKSASAAGSKGENLRDGECAWPDRPLSANEPDLLTRQLSCNPTVSGRVDAYGVAALSFFHMPFDFLHNYGHVYGFYVQNWASGQEWNVQINSTGSDYKLYIIR